MIPLVAPTITATDRNAMADAAWRGMLTDERWVRRYEEAFAARVGCAGAVAVASGTEALTLVVGRHPSVPSYACSALYNAGGPLGSVVDSHFDVRTALMRQDEGTVLVHAFGRPTVSTADADVEDYTLSLGGVPNLRGRVGVCSTHASKMLSTGRGGIVFSNDEALLDEVRALAYYDTVPNGRLGGYSLGMSSMQAQLGLSQLSQLDAFIERRREIAFFYTVMFDNAGIECPGFDCPSVFFRYLIGVNCPECKVRLLAQRGIEAGRGVYPPLHQQLGLPDDQFPGATAAVQRLLSVPCHPSLTDEQVRYIANNVLEVCA